MTPVTKQFLLTLAILLFSGGGVLLAEICNGSAVLRLDDPPNSKWHFSVLGMNAACNQLTRMRGFGVPAMTLNKILRLFAATWRSRTITLQNRVWDRANPRPAPAL